MNTIVEFMNAAVGRSLRVALGVVLIAYGLVLGGTPGIVVAAIGLAPIALGVWGHCLLEPFTSRAPRAV
jgi:DUF2892 family protein